MCHLKNWKFELGKKKKCWKIAKPLEIMILFIHKSLWQTVVYGVSEAQVTFFLNSKPIWSASSTLLRSAGSTFPTYLKSSRLFYIWNILRILVIWLKNFNCSKYCKLSFTSSSLVPSLSVIILIGVEYGLILSSNNPGCNRLIAINVAWNWAKAWN